MKEVVEHLNAALNILTARRADAKNRYDKYEARFKRSTTASSKAMREAWYEYRATGDMIKSINDALATAPEVPT